MKIEKAYAATGEEGNIAKEEANVNQGNENSGDQISEPSLPEVKNLGPEPNLPIVQDVQPAPAPQSVSAPQISTMPQITEQPKNSINDQDENLIQDDEDVDAFANWEVEKIQINKGAQYTNNPVVDIDLKVKINKKDPKEMKIANSLEDLDTAHWQKYKTKIKNWKLILSPDGEKTVYFQFKKGKQISEIYQASIILDTTAPQILSAKTASTNNINDTIILTFSEPINDTGNFLSKLKVIDNLGNDSYAIALTGAISNQEVAYLTLSPSFGGNTTFTIQFEANAFADLATNPNEEQEIIAIDGIAPQTPLNFQVISGVGYIEMSWSPVDDAVAYEIWRAASPFAFYYEVPAPTTNFRDYGVTNGITYYYQVRARDAAGNLSPLLPLNLALSGMSYSVYAPAVETPYQPIYQPKVQPQIASAVVEKEAIKEQEQAPAPAEEKPGEVKGNETPQEEASTNWPLIIGIILAGLVVLFWIYYWYVSWRESRIKTKTRTTRKK